MNRRLASADFSGCDEAKEHAMSLQAMRSDKPWSVLHFFGRLLLLLAALIGLGAWGGEACAAATYQAAGTAVNGTTTTGIGANPAWPAHTANDIALLFVESAGGEPVTLSIPNGFVAVPNSPQATGTGTAGTQLTVFWARATTSAMAAPRIAAPSDHFYAQIVTFRGVINTGNPIDATAGGTKPAASTSVTLPGVTTTVANTLIVQAVARDNDSAGAAFSLQSNVNLTGISELADAGMTNIYGSGGGLGVWNGVMPTAGATGNTTATVANSINAFLTIALKPQAGPQFQAAGAAVGGTGAVSPAWPVHAIDDVALLFVESTGGQAVSAPAGFVFAAVANSPQAVGAGTAGTRLTVFWARATSGAMGAPTVADPGNHVYAQIVTYRGVANTGNPWDVTAGGTKTSASTSVNVAGVTTTVADTLIVQAVARDTDNAAAAFSAQTNASLTGIGERVDAGTTQGNGGGFAVWDGYKATIGATGTTTATVTSSINAFLTIALKPQAATASAPVFGAAGTAVAMGLNWPAHAIGDVALLFIETAGGETPTLADAAGFVQVTSSPQATGAGTAGTRITAFWARATSTAMPGPTITGPADHVYAQIITYRGAASVGNPWDVTGGGVKAAASTSVTVTGVTTTVPSTLIVQAVARANDSATAAFSAQANANLTGITERSDLGTTTGLGGGFAVWDGAKATAGATGNTTATVTSSINAFITIALRPLETQPHHYELSLPASGVACLAGTVTVKACADNNSPCTTPITTMAGQTATLAANICTLGATTVGFDDTGTATTTLNCSAAADGATVTVTLSGESVLTTPVANARQCCQGGVCAVANSCSATNKTAGFIFSAVADGAEASIAAQQAGVTSSAYYLRAIKTATIGSACEPALAGANPVNLGYACSNPNSCSAGSLLDITPYNLSDVPQAPTTVPPGSTAVTLYFDPNGNAKFAFNYRDAGQIAIIPSKAAGGSLLTPLSGSSNAFVTKPWGFLLAATCADATVNAASQATPNPGDPKFCRAGQNFNATATAITQAGNATPNYGKETAPETAAVAWTRELPASGVDGTLPSGSLPYSGSGGVFGPPVPALTWDEVGILRAVITVGDNDYLGAGNVSSTAYVGRFYPDHFNVTITPPPSCTGFVYAGRGGGTVTLGQSFTVSATAMNGKALPTTTTNYYYDPLDGFSRNVDLTLTAPVVPVGNIYVDTTPGGAGAIPADKFILGVGEVAYNDAGPTISYVFDSFPTTATSIALHAEDLETIVSPMVASTDVPISARSGRLRLLNAYGSELLPLRVPLRAEYYDNGTWKANATDSCTTVPTGTIAIGNVKPPASLLAPSASLPVTLINGQSTIVLTQGVTKYVGSVDLALNLRSDAGNDQSCVTWGTTPVTTGATLSWLQYPWCATKLDPNARATFGSPKAPYIYLRERY